MAGPLPIRGQEPQLEVRDEDNAEVDRMNAERFTWEDYRTAHDSGARHDFLISRDPSGGRASVRRLPAARHRDARPAIAVWAARCSCPFEGK